MPKYTAAGSAKRGSAYIKDICLSEDGGDSVLAQKGQDKFEVSHVDKRASTQPLERSNIARSHSSLAGGSKIDRLKQVGTVQAHEGGCLSPRHRPRRAKCRVARNGNCRLDKPADRRAKQCGPAEIGVKTARFLGAYPH